MNTVMMRRLVLLIVLVPVLAMLNTGCGGPTRQVKRLDTTRR